MEEAYEILKKKWVKYKLQPALQDLPNLTELTIQQFEVLRHIVLYHEIQDEFQREIKKQSRLRIKAFCSNLE